MRILVIHQNYLAPGEPGGSRFNELARLWAEAGHEVTVIAGTINYATGKAATGARKRWVSRERDDQVEVLRAHVPGSYAKGYIGRMWAFFGFTLSSGTAIFATRRPDVIIATSPPLIVAIPGFLASRRRWKKIPWVFEIRDLWPESAVSTGVLREGGALTRILYALERWACARADRINVLTPAFEDDLVRRELASREKIAFVPNGVDPEQFCPRPRDNSARRELGWGDKIVAMYAGAHGRANALGQLVDAAEVLRNREDILIACVGDGPERSELSRVARNRGLENIQFVGPIAKTEMPDVVNASDIGLAVLQDNPTFRTVYPNKVFDYMACARPTVLAIDGVARTLVCDQAKAGVFARPERGAEIAARIRELADAPAERAAMGQRGREWVLANATRHALADKYLGILEQVAGQ